MKLIKYIYIYINILFIYNTPIIFHVVSMGLDMCDRILLRCFTKTGFGNHERCRSSRSWIVQPCRSKMLCSRLAYGSPRMVMTMETCFETPIVHVLGSTYFCMLSTSCDILSPHLTGLAKSPSYVFVMKHAMESEDS